MRTRARTLRRMRMRRRAMTTAMTTTKMKRKGRRRKWLVFVYMCLLWSDIGWQYKTDKCQDVDALCRFLSRVWQENGRETKKKILVFCG